MGWRRTHGSVGSSAMYPLRAVGTELVTVSAEADLMNVNSDVVRRDNKERSGAPVWQRGGGAYPSHD
jgi:hypothetical protein